MANPKHAGRCGTWSPREVWPWLFDVNRFTLARRVQAVRGAVVRGRHQG